MSLRKLTKIIKYIFIIFLLLAFILFIVGLFSNYWFVANAIQPLFKNEGFYQICTLTACTLKLQQLVLTFFIIGFILSIHAVLLTMLLLFIRSQLNQQTFKLISILALAYNVLTTILVIIGWAFSRTMITRVNLAKPGWSFVLVSISFPLFLVSIIFNMAYVIMKVFGRRDDDEDEY